MNNERHVTAPACRVVCILFAALLNSFEQIPDRKDPFIFPIHNFQTTIKQMIFLISTSNAVSLNYDALLSNINYYYSIFGRVSCRSPINL